MIIVVKRGDTLFEFSETFGISVEKIKADNGLSDDSLLVGQSLILDIPEEIYIPGENTTLQEIGSFFDKGQKTLYRNNYFLGGRNRINAGDEVVIEYKNIAQTQKIIGGYCYDFIPVDTLYSVVNYLTYVMPFTYGITADGGLIEPNDSFILRCAKQNDVKALLHLSTLGEDRGFDSSLLGKLYQNDGAVNNLIENVISAVTMKEYDGVDIDFEYLPQEQKENYVDFTGRLSAALHDIGKILVIALPPKTSDDQAGILYEGIDYRALGENADYVLVMAYEYGYRFGPPMAVAPINRIEPVMRYAASRIDSNKILLGMSNYGYDWTLPFVRGESEAPSVSPLQAIDIAKKYKSEILFDEPAKAPYFYYTDENGREHIVYFEDARSFEAKVNLMVKYNLSGGFIWEISRQNPQGFVTLNSLLNIE